MARYKARIVERKVLGDAPRPRACIGPRYGISLSVTHGPAAWETVTVTGV